MKNIILLFAVFTIYITPSFCQKLTDDKVPLAVRDSFNARFPKLIVTSWELEDNKEYEASFKLDELRCTASFDLKGNWMETECIINVSWLPKVVSDAASREFKGYTIKTAEQTVSPKGTKYELGLVKGTDKKTVSISDKGVILNKDDK